MVNKNWNKLKEFYNELSENIELMNDLNLLPSGKDNVYENMHKLSSKLGKQIDLIERNCLMIKVSQWKKLKEAGLDLDSLYNWDKIHKKVSNQLWSVINKVEGVIE